MVEAKKTRNTRGLFRVPEMTDDNHLIVEAKPRENDDEEKDVMQIPNIQGIPQVKPNVSRQLNIDSDSDSEPEEGKDPIERYDEGRMSIKDYIEMAKRKPGRDMVS